MSSFDDDLWSEHDDEDGIGYGRPPKHWRFKRGRSGNPSGKPGESNSAAYLRQALLQRVSVKLNGNQKMVTKLEVFVTQLINKAVLGDYRSIRLVLSHARWLHRELIEPSRQRRGVSPETKRALERALCGQAAEEATIADDKPTSSAESAISGQPEVEPQDIRGRAGLSEVGYRKPPRQGRFQKGRSGNPNGRPSAGKNFETLLKRLLLSKVRITENGCAREVLRSQAILEQIVNRAALGSPRFQVLLLEYASSADIELASDFKSPKNLVEIFRKRLDESMSTCRY